MRLKAYRNPPDFIDKMSDTSWFIHAQIFDNVLIVANAVTACFVLKTTDGLIVIDAIYPKEEVFNVIIESIKDIGWNPEEIKKLVITHGHFDHCGCGKWIVDSYRAKTYLSKIDDEYWEQKPFFPDNKATLKNFTIDYYVNDGDEINLGNTAIKVIFTPGHTPGGLSYIFPVYDNEIKHVAGIWGGSTPPNNVKDIVTYLRSLDHFMEEAEKHNCDVILTNHPVMDSYEKIIYARNRCSHMPNVYVIGEKGFRHFCQLYRSMCYDMLLQLSGA